MGRPDELVVKCTYVELPMECFGGAVWWVTGRPTCADHLRVRVAADLAGLNREGPKPGHVLHVEPMEGRAGGPNV